MIIDDANLIDQVNPFLVEPPGTWSRPYDFGLEDPDKETPAMWETSDESPACETSATGSDNQTQWCHPGAPNCPMRRALEPTQRADPDITYPNDPGMAPDPVAPIAPPAQPKTEWLLTLVLLVILGFIVLVVL